MSQAALASPPSAPSAPPPSSEPNDVARRIAETMAAIRSLHGSEKAAVLLLALGEDAKAIWERLDDEELREISAAMSNLGPVKSEMVEFLIKDFVNRLSGSGAVTGNYDQTHKLLLQFLPFWALVPIVTDKHDIEL